MEKPERFKTLVEPLHVCVIVIGPHHLLDLHRVDAAPWIVDLRPWMLWSFFVVTGASLAGAVVIARSPRRRSRPRRWLVGIAVTVLAVTVYVGLREDVGPMTVTMRSLAVGPDVLPDLSLRTTLLVSGTLSLFTLVASYVLACRRREDSAIRG